MSFWLVIFTWRSFFGELARKEGLKVSRVLSLEKDGVGREELEVDMDLVLLPAFEVAGVWGGGPKTRS